MLCTLLIHLENTEVSLLDKEVHVDKVKSMTEWQKKKEWEKGDFLWKS